MSKKQTFAHAFTRLEEIAERLEDHDLELEKAEKLIEEARELEILCRGQLENQKLRITKLLAKKDTA